MVLHAPGPVEAGLASSRSSGAATPQQPGCATRPAAAAALGGQAGCVPGPDPAPGAVARPAREGAGDGTGVGTGVETGEGAREAPRPAARRADADRREWSGDTTKWLSQMLDEVDHGMVLVDEGLRVLHANHAARSRLVGGHPLQLTPRQLGARDAADQASLLAAATAAGSGLRRLITVGRDDDSAVVAVLPLGALGLGGPRAVLVMLCRREPCTALSVQLFAGQHGLTPAETRVLQALHQGLDAREAAATLRVHLTTIRSHIAAIRTKLGVASLSEVMHRLARLPPMVSVLRDAGR